VVFCEWGRGPQWRGHPAGPAGGRRLGGYSAWRPQSPPVPCPTLVPAWRGTWA